MRGLSISRAVEEMEAGQRGDFSNLQWLYQTIERRDAVVRGAKRRILAAIVRLSWDIKISSGIAESLKPIAEDQRRKLKAAYHKTKGLRETLKHLALAEFRGFAHVEKHYAPDGSVIALEPVPQWHWCRDGLYGDWLFKLDASCEGIRGEPIETGRFIIREVEDPINEIALIAVTRKGLSSKDFDGFVARYGITFIYWVMSDSMASALAGNPDEIAKCQRLMRGIGSDGEGIIPGGKLESLNVSLGGKDQNPFLQHLGHQDAQIVMAATSGKLTMLHDKAGNGGNAEAHRKTFEDIAAALAMEISEVMHDQFDIPELARMFPDHEPLVYFELAAKNTKNVGALVSNVKTLSDAGWEMDLDQLKEKTGLKLSKRSAPTAAKNEIPARQQNRRGIETEAAFPKAFQDLIANPSFQDFAELDLKEHNRQRREISQRGVCRGFFRDLMPVAKREVWTHIVPRGEFPGTIEIEAGRHIPGFGVVKEAKTIEVVTVIGDSELNSIMSSFSDEILIDQDHLSHIKTETTEAMGWGKSLRIMASGNGLELESLWTPGALDKIRKKIYRFISPEFAGNVMFERETFRFYPTALVGAALTNRPKLTTINPVIWGLEPEA